MICEQCETVAHCTKYGCVPKQPAPVPLTDAEIEQLASKYLDVGDGERGTHYVFGEIKFARAILAAAQRQCEDDK
jgi:hypothetical protein